MSLEIASLVPVALVASLALSLPAQHQFAELGKRHLPPDRDQTWAVADGDVDGDGDQDLVFGNSWGNRLYLNDGTGTFTDATASRMPMDSDDTRAVLCCDVDGDGDQDLVCGNWDFYGRQNRLYLNDGTGTFIDATATRLPIDRDGTLAALCFDADGDGDQDLVFANAGQNRLYLNDGAGTFADATASRMPMDSDSSQAVARCDVDGDGDQDLVFANAGQNRLYLNDGTGAFTDVTGSRLPTTRDETLAVACCDVDGDGDPDLVFGNGPGLPSGPQNRLYLNDGTGTFTDATASRLPADSDETRAVAWGDVDGDGDPDLVFGNGDFARFDQNRLYLNDGAGTFTEATASRMPQPGDHTEAVLCCDVDGDGDLDLAFGNHGDQKLLYSNDGRGTFTDATASPLPVEFDYTADMDCCDVDGDGDLDLVFANGFVVGEQNQNRLYLNDGTGRFTDATVSRMPTDDDPTRAVTFCDVDGDGDPDLVLGNAHLCHAFGCGPPHQNRLYLNDGRGTFTDATASSMPSDTDVTVDVLGCDVDGDGDQDLVFATTSGFFGPVVGQNRLYLNNGTGRFTDVTASRMPTQLDSTQAVACCDVDGDGDLDLVFGNYGDQNRLYLNDGTGTFTDATASRLPTDRNVTNDVECCDVDGDGDPDLVFGNGDVFTGEQNRLYLNDGSGTFTDATAARMPTQLDSTQAVACRDLDGDGDPDLLFGNQGQQNDHDRLYLNDGTGAFIDATATHLPPNTERSKAVLCLDVDGDGDRDLVLGAARSRLYLNLLRQLDAPFLLRVGHTYRLDAYARRGPARLVDVALPFVSSATARIPLPPLGTFGLAPSLMAALPAFVIPQPAGMGSVSVAVPNDPSLVGAALYAQALLVQHPVQDRLTNVTADLVLR